MAEILKFSDIPSTDFKIEDKEYPMVILDAKLETTPKGFKCISVTWEHLGSPKFKINFDRYIYGSVGDEDFNLETPAVRVGLQKLKNLNAVTLDKDDLNPAIFAKLLTGQKAYVLVTSDDKYQRVNGIDAFRKYETSYTPEPENSEDINQLSFDFDEDPFNE